MVRTARGLRGMRMGGWTRRGERACHTQMSLAHSLHPEHTAYIPSTQPTSRAHSLHTKYQAQASLDLQHPFSR